MKNKIRLIVIATFALLLVGGWDFRLSAKAAVPDFNEIVSTSSGSSQGNGASSGVSISGDGRYVAFTSDANNLVNGDTNGKTDVFVRDRTNGTTTRISVSSSGTQANDISSTPRISNDGRFIVYDSYATNLVSSDTNNHQDVFEYDMATGTTTLVSLSASGIQGNNDSLSPDVSADGRFVTFLSNASTLVSNFTPAPYRQVFIKDTWNGAIKAVSKSTGGYAPDGQVTDARVNCSGNVVVFESYADNLVANDNNSNPDVFIDTIGWGGDRIVDATANGNGSSAIGKVAISCDGNSIAYETGATNLVSGYSTNGVIEQNRLTGINSRIDVSSSGTSAQGYYPSLSGDGRYVAFFASGNTTLDSNYNYPLNGYCVYVRDMKSGTTQLLSIDLGGNGAAGSQQPAISADGAWVAYTSYAEDTSYHPTAGIVASDTNGASDTFASKTGY